MRLIAYILRLLRVSFTQKHLRDFFWTHPDRNNMLGYVRILSYYGIETNAKKIESLDSIDDKSFLHLSYLTNHEFILIKNISSSEVVIHNGFYQKKLSRKEFVSQWNGVVLQLKKTKTATEPFYKKNKINAFKTFFILISFLILALIVILMQHSFVLSIKTFINLGINIIACYTAFLLFNKNFTPFKKHDICSVSNLFQCNFPKSSILNVELSDIGISYFGTAILTTLLFPNLYPALSIYYILAIPFSIWSILYQLVWIRKICPYCTIIQILVFLLAYLNLNISFFRIVEVIDFLVIVSVFLFLLFLIESLYRPYYEKIVELYENSYNLNQCKIDLIKQRYNNNNDNKEIYNEAPHDIELGMDSANNYLTVIINLYCRSCGIEFIKTYNSLKLSQTVKTRFVVACLSKEQKKDFSILLSLHTSGLPIDKLIFDWFSLGREKFLKYYNNNNNAMNNVSNINNIISSHYKWVENNNITETPACILNGIKFPSNIQILDIINTI